MKRLIISALIGGLLASMVLVGCGEHESRTNNRNINKAKEKPQITTIKRYSGGKLVETYKITGSVNEDYRTGSFSFLDKGEPVTMSGEVTVRGKVW